MKKCASCSKDLPDAALHCVFCGAKQASAPIPSAAGANAKTVMGAFSAQDVIAQLKQQGATPGMPGMSGGTQPAPVAYAPPVARSAVQTPTPPPSPSPLASGALAPASHAHAATMMAQAPVIPTQIPYGTPGASVQQATVIQPAPVIPAYHPTPAAYPGSSGAAHASPAVEAVPYGDSTGHSGPTGQPAYLAMRNAGREGRPRDPYRDSLRVLVLIFGVLVVARLAVPQSTTPMTMGFTQLFDGTGLALVTSLAIAAMGVLGILLSFVPMPSAARGAVVGLLGTLVMVVPQVQQVMAHSFQWQSVLAVVAMVLLLPGLVLRSKYTDATLPRLLVTLGVLAYLATVLVPDGHGIPLVNDMQAVIRGAFPTAVLFRLITTVLVILSLLAWLPTPGTGGAGLWFWLLVLLVLAMHVLELVFGNGNIGAMISTMPAVALFQWAIPATAMVFVGYGWAAALGKSLE